MSNFYILTTPARQDIDDISHYIAERNLEAAYRFLNTVTQKFQTLAQLPEMGRRRDELAPGLRSFPVENYLIFYRLVEGGIQILRVVSGFRDLEALFQNDDEEI